MAIKSNTSPFFILFDNEGIRDETITLQHLLTLTNEVRSMRGMRECSEKVDDMQKKKKERM